MSRDEVGPGAANVREVAQQERARAVALQVLAFGADPFMRWFFPEPDAYLSHYPALAAAFAGPSFEHRAAYVAGDFLGCALWQPPGVKADVAAILGAFENVTSPAREELPEMFEDMERHHIDEPHWYLPMIGVDPARRGQGVGSALLAHGLALCDAAGLPAYLESSNPANVPLYERHGFAVLATVQAGSSPPIFPMLRDARA